MTYYNRPKTEEERAAAAAAYQAKREAEQAALKIKREEYQMLTLDIALELGAAWAGNGNNDLNLSDHTIGQQIITTAEGQTIHLHFNSYEAKNRVKISGSYGQYANGTYIQTKEEQPTITAALTRTPAAIARDIQARFMPQFLKAKAEAEQKRKEDDAAIIWAREKAKFMIAYFGYWIADSHHKQDPETIKNTSVRLHAHRLPSLEIRGSFKSIEALDRLPVENEKQLFEILEVLSGKNPGNRTRKHYRRSPRQPWRHQRAEIASRKQQPEPAANALFYA